MRVDLRGTIFHEPVAGAWLGELPDCTFGEYLGGTDRDNPGAPDEVRGALYAKIARTFLRGGKRAKPPQAVLVIGLGCSGKTSALGNLPLPDNGNRILIDPDEVKKYLPEYQTATQRGRKDAASIVHAESGFVAEIIRNEAARRSFNFSFEGVGRDAAYYTRLAENLESHGYVVHVLLSHLDDLDEALRRNKVRGERTGRYIPETSILEAFDRVPHTFTSLVASSRYSRDYTIVCGRTGSYIGSRRNGVASGIHPVSILPHGISATYV